MRGDPMTILAAAHRRLVEAKQTLADAATAVEAAQKFAAEATRELAVHVQKHEHASALRGAALKQALKLGSTAAYVTPPGLAADHIERTAAEHRHEVARQALDDLVGEEAAAAKVVAQAVAAVHEAARAVIATEVEHTVAKVIELELEAMRLRTEIEGSARSSVVGWGAAIALGASGKAILVGNQQSPIGTKNDSAWHRANASAEGWRKRFEFLVETDSAPVACRRRRAIAAE
jgi:hypothetical protein